VPLQNSNAAQTEGALSDHDDAAARVRNWPGGLNYICYRWVVSDSGLQMLPISKKRSFNWSYLLAQRLRRINPGKFF